MMLSCCVNGQINEPTLERLGKIRGKTVRRGLDSAINECLDLLEDNTNTTNEKGQVVKIENAQKVDCLNDDCKEELAQNAS